MVGFFSSADGWFLLFGASAVMEKIDVLAFILIVVAASASSDSNPVFQPCGDTTIQRSDGFSLGIAFASRQSFFFNNTQLSPCDHRLSLSSGPNSQVVIFRPKVDEISLLTVNSTPNTYVNNGGYMVAFAGRKYAARSLPTFVGNNTYLVTSFTLVLEFDKGRLLNLYWKKDGCASCSGKSSLVCINQQECAVRTSSCKGMNDGKMDCNLGTQLAFSGTDKHLTVLNSWYEVSKLRQYSLHDMYSNIKDSFAIQYNKFF